MISFVPTSKRTPSASCMRQLAVALLLASGCSTSLSIQRPISSSDEQQLDRLLRDREATLTYAPPGVEPKKDAASDVTVADDKVQWVLWDSEQARTRGSPPGQRVEAPIDAVRKISVCEPECQRRGVLEGMAVGAIAGGIVSAILVARCNAGSGLGSFCKFGWIPAPVLGIAIGGLIGIRGHPTIVEFEPPPRKQ